MLEIRKANINDIEKISEVLKIAYDVPYKKDGMISSPHISESLQNDMTTGKTFFLSLY